MKKSLYLKFILGYIFFALLSFFTIATISARLTYHHCLEQQAGLLRADAVRMADECSSLYTGGSETPETLYPELTRISSFLDARLWIIDMNGTIAYDSEGELKDTTVEEFDPADTAKSYRTGNFYHVFSENMLTVTAPIAANFRTYGYVVMHTPIAHINSLSDGMLLPIYSTFVIIFALSLLILLIFRFHVIKPLKQITQAAKEYAAGNLKYECKVDSEDEMGYLADSLNFMAHELSNSEEYQRKFIANVSHDFRSPLTSIRGYLEAIVDGTIPPESQEKYLKIVINETERLTGLTQNMLSLNSLERKAMHLERISFDINQVIKDTCATFEGTCSRRDINFSLTFPEVNTFVYADRSKIQQVIYNLVDNAIKFSHDNSTIRIDVYEQHDKIFISVKDTGIGIPKKDQKKIWDRFFKSDSSRGKDKKGTGLGLSIVKEIIQAHEETIDVISTEGVGTEFIFRLPKGQAH